MSGYQAALDYLAKLNGPTNQSPDPLAAPTPAQGAQIIDFETPLPEMGDEPDFISIPEASEETLADPAYEPAPAPSQPMGDGYTAALAYLERQQADQQAQAATQQAVAEATTPDDRLPIATPELADALGVLDYRDPQEGARRSQAAALGEILGLPEYEKVKLGAAPVNADGTVTIRRAQAVSPEANAAAAKQMALIQAQAAADLAPPSRPVEYYNRAERGARLGVEDVRSGFYSIVENFFKDQQNPYLYSSPQTAEADVPKIETRLADLQQRRTEFVKGDLGPNRDRISPFDQEISSLTGQLEKARQATTGEPVTENFLGSVSRASADLATEARENQSAIRTDYTDKQITPERDKEFWMTVADGLGRTVPTAGAAILNPYLGLAMGYTQVYSNAEQEFDQAAAQTGKPLDPAARSDYAHSQALLQTPFELVGDLALAKVARDSIASSGQALIRSIRGGDTTAVSSFVANLPRRAGQLGAAAAGETLITTPAQTIIEQKVAESAGVRDPISNAQLAANTGQAMKVAAAQSLLLGGGPVALETGVTTIADRLRRPASSAQPPVNPQVNPQVNPAPAEVPQNFTPISSPAPAATGPAPRTLGQVRAPQIAIDPAALDETFGPATGTPPAASAPAASAPTAPEPTGSPELIAGEGASVSDWNSIDTATPDGTPPRPAYSFSTDAITPEQTALAADFSARLTSQLGTQGVIDSSLTLTPVNLDRVDAGAGMSDFIDTFSRLTDTRVQFVKASDPTIFGGAVRSDDAKTIFLNADSQRPVAALIGHEWGHSLQYTQPALYKDLRRVVAAYTDNYRARARESAASPIYRSGSASQRARTQAAELTNNTLGDAFLDPSFWESVRNENKPLVQKLWTSFNEWVDSLLNRQSQSTFGTPQFATDLAAMRRNLAKTIAPALRGMENATATEQSILAFSTDRSTLFEDGVSGTLPLDSEEALAKPGSRLEAQSQSDSAPFRSNASGRSQFGVPAENAFSEISYAPARVWGLRRLAERFEAARNSVGGQSIQPPIYRADYDAHRAAFREAAQAAERLYRDTLNSVDAANASRKGTADYLLPRLPEVRALFTDANSQVQLLGSRPVELEPGETLFAAEPKPRKFGQSLQAAPGVAPEVKSRLTSLDYDPVSNAQTLANARARIDSAGSIDTALTDLMGKPAIEGWQPTAEDYATGMELMGQLQNRSRHADAASIANMMATRATDQGRAIQALSMIGRLGPQGIELFAQRQLQAAATKPAKTDKQKADIQAKITEAGQLQGEVDKLRRDSTTAAIVGNKDLIKSSLPAGVDAVQVNIAIREAILGAPTPLAAQAATSSILTGQGLSDKGAARISGSIVRDFLKTTQDTRATVLQDLLATADSDRRLDKSKLGSLIRLNREGKLTDASLHAGMAKMLGIPHWSAEHSAKVRRILAQHEKATDPRIKLVKAAEALDVVYRDFMPPGFLDKVDAIQTIAMLLNPKTVIRNVVGNTLMAGADLAADAVSVPMDALVSLGTGERTRTGLSLGERLMGLGAGVGDIKAGYDFARSEGRGRMESIAEGVDTLVRLGRLQSSGKYNASDISALSGPTFTAPVLRQLESTLGLALSITDRGFYESAFRASLDTRMNAAAANGNPMLAPDTDMVTAARMDAGRAIYQDDNAASRTLSDLRRALNRNKRWGIGSLLMKFTQVPGSILTRAVEFSPLGFINTAYQSLAPMLSNSREFDQQAFTDSFSRALVGTTGLVATGYWLAHLGIISAGSDSKDEDKRNLNRAMGWGTYKLNVDALKRALMTGNFWTPQKQQRDDMVIGYDWAQPLSIGVAMGAYARENQDAVRQDILSGKKQDIFANGLNWLAYAGGAVSGAMNSLVEQPLLSGINQFAREVSYDNFIGALLKTAADAPGTFIPTAARQWMQLTDNAARETRDSSPARQYINELKAQLPGLSKTLPPKYDITGQPIERWAKDSNTLFNVLFNPSMVSYIKSSPALTEMNQVYKYTAETGAVPNPVKPEFKLDKVTVRLTSEEISAMQKDMGALSIAALEKFVLSDPRYDKATWDIKAKAMTRALEKAATAAKYRILLARPDLKDRAKQEYDAAIANRAATQSDMLAPVGP
jgi:hypothetical protein